MITVMVIFDYWMKIVVLPRVYCLRRLDSTVDRTADWAVLLGALPFTLSG